MCSQWVPIWRGQCWSSDLQRMRRRVGQIHLHSNQFSPPFSQLLSQSWWCRGRLPEKFSIIMQSKRSWGMLLWSIIETISVWQSIKSSHQYALQWLLINTSEQNSNKLKMVSILSTPSNRFYLTWEQSTLNHQSQMKYAWWKSVPVKKWD